MIRILWLGEGTGEEQGPGLSGKGKGKSQNPVQPQSPLKKEKNRGPLYQHPPWEQAFCCVTLSHPDDLCPFLI